MKKPILERWQRRAIIEGNSMYASELLTYLAVTRLNRDIGREIFNSRLFKWLYGTGKEII